MDSAPHEKKEASIRGKLLPKGLFGYELAPVNEAVMRTWRAAMASCLTFVTSGSSTDLTFSATARGDVVDLDVATVCRKAIAFGGFLCKSDQLKPMTDETLRLCEEEGEPGCYKREENLRENVFTGESTSLERARLRKQCKWNLCIRKRRQWTRSTRSTSGISRWSCSSMARSSSSAPW